MKLPSETREYRSLTGGRSALVTTDRFCTGDRFRTTKIKGADWLLYLCRADDLLVHTSGEMTNPLPTEQIILAECAGLVEAACCCGNSMARPLLLLELVEGAQLDDLRTLGAHGVAAGQEGVVIELQIEYVREDLGGREDERGN